jgi:galactokinase
MTPRVWQCAHHIVTENERVLGGVQAWEKGETAAFGELMWASHESSRVDFHNSCPELDALVTRARQAGAWGARLSGGGFGGATINLVATEKAEALVQALGAECLITRAAAGARVVSA